MWASVAIWYHIEGVKQRAALWAATTLTAANHPMILILLGTVTLAGEQAF